MLTKILYLNAIFSAVIYIYTENEHITDLRQKAISSISSNTEKHPTRGELCLMLVMQN